MPPGHIFGHVPCFESVLHEDICARFVCEHLTFKVLVLRCWHKFSHMQMGLKVFCMMMPNTWADAGPLEGKYLVSTVNFQHIL